MGDNLFDDSDEPRESLPLYQVCVQTLSEVQAIRVLLENPPRNIQSISHYGADFDVEAWRKLIASKMVNICPLAEEKPDDSPEAP